MTPIRLLLAAACLAAPAFVSAAAAIAATAETPARFSVEVEGKGPDVIMIPGLMSGRAVWDEALAGLEGRYRVHRLQLAGFAGEPAGPNADGPLLEPMVEALHAYIAAHKLEKPAIVGHSMGGMLALMLAARHPEDAGKVLVVDALPFYSLLFSPDATPEAVAPQAAALRDALAAMPDDAFEAQQRATLASLVKAEEARPALLADALASDRAVAARAVHEVMTTDMRSELGAIRVPVTIAYATNAFAPDARMGPLYRAAYAGLAQAALVEVPDSYHFIMLDQPGGFAAMLAGFLAGE